MHPTDAAARGIADGDIVRLFNDRGACLAAARAERGHTPGRGAVSTGAWYDPDDPEEDRPVRARQSERADARCRHVEPGAGLHRAAHDRRGGAFDGNLPPIRAYDPPEMAAGMIAAK